MAPSPTTNDTATYRVSVFDYDTESGLTRQRTFVETEGRPDSLTVDSEGGVWVAISNGGAIHRYTPTGEPDAVIELPVQKVTACTFGGAHLDQLFITTSREGLDPDDDTPAGSLFRADVGITGMPVREFAG